MLLLCMAPAVSSLARASSAPHRRITSARPRAQPLAITTSHGTFVPVSFDGHVHTRHSPDAFSDPRSVLALAQRLGLDAIIFTDHGSTVAASDVQELSAIAKSAPGQEIGGPFGHAVMWNTVDRDTESSSVSLARRSAYAHEHGGLIVLAHPGWWIRGVRVDPWTGIRIEALRSGGKSANIDAIEIWNGVYSAPTRKLVASWVELLDAGIYVPVVGGSDFHNPRTHRLGHPRNVALCTTPDVACILEAAKHGRLYITDGPALAFTANEALPGDVISGAPGSLVHVALEAVAPGGGTLVLYQGHEAIQRVEIDAQEKTTAAFDLTMPADDSYLRVEIEQPSKHPNKPPVLMLLSNPILLDPEPARASWR